VTTDRALAERFDEHRAHLQEVDDAVRETSLPLPPL
jgi:hypothetical protein